MVHYAPDAHIAITCLYIPVPVIKMAHACVTYCFTHRLTLKMELQVDGNSESLPRIKSDDQPNESLDT